MKRYIPLGLIVLAGIEAAVDAYVKLPFPFFTAFLIPTLFLSGLLIYGFAQLAISILNPEDSSIPLLRPFTWVMGLVLLGTPLLESIIFNIYNGILKVALPSNLDQVSLAVIAGFTLATVIFAFVVRQSRKSE